MLFVCKGGIFILRFPRWLSGKETACHAGDTVGGLVSIPGGEDPLEEEMAPTPVFLPGKPHGQRSLVGHSPRGHKESATERHLTAICFLYYTALHEGHFHENLLRYIFA